MVTAKYLREILASLPDEATVTVECESGHCPHPLTSTYRAESKWGDAYVVLHTNDKVMYEPPTQSVRMTKA